MTVIERLRSSSRTLSFQLRFASGDMVDPSIHLHQMGRAKNKGLKLLEDHWWAADSLALEIYRNLDPVGNLDKGNSTVHSELLAVESHRSFDFSGSCPDARHRKRQRFGFGHPAYCECSRDVERGGARLDDLGRMECDIWILLSVEEVFAPELIVFHSASRIYAGCINLDVQNTGFGGGGSKR